jgi:hypothetical protein
MTFIDNTLDSIGNWLAGILQKESSGYRPFTPSDPETLERTLQPGDILLIEGNQKINPDTEKMTYAQSVTDACLGWDDTEILLDGLAANVRARRAL